MKRNIEALRAVRDQVAFSPKTHDQSWWGQMTSLPSNVVQVGNALVAVECETAACVAGWAITQAKDLMLYDESQVEHVVATGEISHRVLAQYCMDKAGKKYHIPNRAKQLLGITKAQGNVLFQPDWNTEEVVEMLDILLKDDVSNQEATKQLRAMAVEHGVDQEDLFYDWDGHLDED